MGGQRGGGGGSTGRCLVCKLLEPSALFFLNSLRPCDLSLAGTTKRKQLLQMNVV